MLEVDVAARIGALELGTALTVAEGRCLALTGPSGAGKTSLLRIVAGLLAPRRGRVSCGGERWLDTGAGVNRPPERRAVGFVFQDHALFAHLSAQGNVAYGMRGPDRRARAGALLERMGLEHRAGARPAELSGGERQRVALARALARDPRVLLLDEPLSALDTRTRAAASRLLAEVLRETRVPALLVTHDFAEAALFGDEVAVLDAGRVVQRGTPADLAARPLSAFVADLTGASVLTGRARPAGDLTEIVLDGGGRLLSTDAVAGPASVALHPWDVGLEAAGPAAAAGSARNRLDAQVISVVRIGNRVRVGLATPQPLTAEVTGPGAEALELEPGARVSATFKASATRLIPR